MTSIGNKQDSASLDTRIALQRLVQRDVDTRISLPEDALTTVGTKTKTDQISNDPLDRYESDRTILLKFGKGTDTDTSCGTTFENTFKTQELPLAYLITQLMNDVKPKISGNAQDAAQELTRTAMSELRKVL